MSGQDSWIRAEMGGTKQASVITKPEILMALLKKMMMEEQKSAISQNFKLLAQH